MALHSVQDDRLERFIVTLTGEVTVDELAEFVATQINQDAWHYSVLYDATTPGVMLTGLQTVLTNTWRELAAEHGPRGYVAFAVADSDQHAVATRYAATAAQSGLFTARVFNDVASAAQWLDAQRSSDRTAAS